MIGLLANSGLLQNCAVDNFALFEHFINILSSFKWNILHTKLFLLEFFFNFFLCSCSTLFFFAICVKTDMYHSGFVKVHDNKTMLYDAILNEC